MSKFHALRFITRPPALPTTEEDQCAKQYQTDPEDTAYDPTSYGTSMTFVVTR